MLKKTLHFVLVITIALGLSISVQSLLAAWTAPIQTAPNCASGTPGCDAPINTSATGQVKSGDFDTLGALSSLGNLTAGGNALISGNASVGGMTTLGGSTQMNGSTLTAAQTTNPHFYFNSYEGIQLRLDSNNNSANSEFQINNGANNSVFYVNENGNVGIGTTAPAYKLTIAGTSTVLGLDNGALISAKNTAGAYQGFLWPRWTDNATYLNYGQNGFYIRNVNASSTMYMNNAGNVGIGTTSPMDKLHVGIGNIVFDNGYGIKGRDTAGNPQTLLSLTSANNVQLIAPAIGGSLQFSVNNASGIMQFISNATEKMRITNAGDVGIGTTTPRGKLHVADTNAELEIESTHATNPWVNLNFTHKGTVVNQIQAHGTDVGSLFFTTKDPGNGTLMERMRIKNNGNVGIGTIAPNARLQIDAPASTEGLRIISASDWSPLNIRNSADTADIFRVDQSGTLATGTIPWTRLASFPAACPANQYVTAIGGTLTCASSGGVTGSGTANYITKWTSGSAIGNSIIYDNGTNVGIGTAAPGAKLVVNGGDVHMNTDYAVGNRWFRIYGNATNYVDLVSGIGVQYLRSHGGALTINDDTTNNVLLTMGGGNVGIGTTNPGAKLEVNGNIQTTSQNSWSKAGYAVAYSYATGGNVGFGGNLFQDTDGAWKYHNTAGWGGKGLAWNLFASDRAELLYAANGVNPATPSALMTIKTATGNVGIGTTNPTNKLSVIAPDNDGLYITPLNVNDQPRVHFSTSHGVGGMIQKYNPNVLDVYGGANTPLTLSANGTEKVRITTAGNVGVGTTVPGAKMQINPPISTEGLRIVSASDWSPLNIRNSGDTADIFRVDQTGSLAVGSIPWDKITNFPAACPANQYVTAVGGTLTCAAVTGTVTGSGTSNYMPKWTSGSVLGNSLVYDDGTNVGIGTAAPAERLEVSVNSTTTDTWPLIVRNSRNNGTMDYDNGIKIKFSNDSTGNERNKWIGIKGVLEGGWANQIGMAFYTQPTAATPPVESMRINKNGNVGIGTAVPGANLDVKGANGLYVYDANGSASNRFKIQYNGTNGLAAVGPDSSGGNTDFGLGTSNAGVYAEKMRITTSGNVGIGTTSPAQKLDVSGTIAVRDGNSYGSINYNAANKALNLVTPNPGSGGSNINLQVGGWSNDYVDINNGGGSSYHRLVANGNSYLAAIGGNVAIGTTTPGYKMHVEGDVYANGWLRSNGATGWYNQTYGGGWYMTDTNWIRTYNNKNIYQNTGIMRTDGTLQVGVSGATLNVVNNGNLSYLTSVLFANTAGNVGMGNTAPGARLQVNASTSAEGIRIVSASDWSPLNIRNSANTADIFRVDQTGSLAVGSIPWARVTSFPAACPAGQYVSAIGGTLTCSTPASSGVSGTGTANYLAKWTSGSAVGNSVLYDNGANVGIGTTAPGEKLDIYNGNLKLNGAGFINPTIKFFDGGGQKAVLGYVDSDDTLRLGYSANGLVEGVNQLVMTSTGNVGVGTTAPGGKLDVKSTGVSSYPLRVTASDNGPMGYLFEDVGQHTIFDLFNGAGTNNVRLNTNGDSWFTGGNVGIGTTTPAYKLEVVGTIKGDAVLNPTYAP